MEYEPMMTIFNVSDEQIPDAEQWLSGYCESMNANLGYRSREFYKAEFENTQRTYMMMGSALSFVLVLIGVLNFINAVVASISARRWELAMLQSVGMTGWQLKQMLFCEGAMYALLTIFFSLTVGSLLSRLIVILSDIDTPYLQSLMRLIETQGKTTITGWCVGYAREHVLPIYEKAYPDDPRCGNAFDAAVLWLEGKVKLPFVKNIILNECHAAAREDDDTPAAQAAARTCGQAAATIHAPTHSLGLALYGALSIAYDKLGADAEWDALLDTAAEECAKMEAALREVAIIDEPNPAKINWRC